MSTSVTPRSKRSEMSVRDSPEEHGAIDRGIMSVRVEDLGALGDDEVACRFDPAATTSPCSAAPLRWPPRPRPGSASRRVPTPTADRQGTRVRFAPTARRGPAECRCPARPATECGCAWRYAASSGTHVRVYRRRSVFIMPWNPRQEPAGEPEDLGDHRAVLGQQRDIPGHPVGGRPERSDRGYSRTVGRRAASEEQMVRSTHVAIPIIATGNQIRRAVPSSTDAIRLWNAPSSSTGCRWIAAASTPSGSARPGAST